MFDITDHFDWLGHRFFQFFHNALLRSHVSYGKTWCSRSSTLGVFYVGQILYDELSRTHPTVAKWQSDGP
jgi:hypothetical protein